MIALILGFIIGFASSVPVGPINLAVMMKGLSNKTGQGLMIGAGSGFMDIIYCGAAMFGISSLMTNQRVVFILQIATFFVFLFFGIKTTFFKIAEAKLTKSSDAPGFKRYFILGALLYISNPSFLAYWITVAGIVHGYHILASSAYNSSLFAVGTGIGATGWFFILLELVERQKMKLDTPTVQRITRVFGVILLLITLVMGYQLIS